MFGSPVRISAGWYSIVCGACFYWLHLPPGWCLLVSWLVSVFFWTIPVYYFVKWRRNVTERKTLRIVAQLEADNAMVEMKEMKELKETNSEKPEKENEDLVEVNSIVPPNDSSAGLSANSSEPQAIDVTPITEVKEDLSTELQVVTSTP